MYYYNNNIEVLLRWNAIIKQIRHLGIDISIVRVAWYWNGAATMLILPREILSVNWRILSDMFLLHGYSILIMSFFMVNLMLKFNIPRYCHFINIWKKNHYKWHYLMYTEWKIKDVFM